MKNLRPKKTNNKLDKALSSLTRLLALSSILTFGLSSCGGSIDASPENLPTPLANIELDLMMAKAKLGGSDFERYNLKQTRLWSECGQLKKRLSKPVFVASEEVPVVVEPKTLLKIESIYQNIEEIISERSELTASLPKPENPFAFLDDGVFELKIAAPRETPVIVTSFAAVKDKENALLERIEELTILLRKATKRPPCGQRTFFGLE